MSVELRNALFNCEATTVCKSNLAAGYMYPLVWFDEDGQGDQIAITAAVNLLALVAHLKVILPIVFGILALIVLAFVSC